MTYVLELKPEVARKIQQQAAQKGVRPEEFLAQLAEENANQDDTQTKYFDPEEVRAMAAKLFDDRAEVFEALAEGAK